MGGIIVTDSGRLAGSGMDCGERRISEEQGMRKGGEAGAYAGRAESLLKQGESRWLPDGGGGAVVT